MKNSDPPRPEAEVSGGSMPQDTDGYVPGDGADSGMAESFTVKDLPPDEQPRERVLRYGISAVSNADLFAIILRTGTRGYPVTALCRDLMDVNDNLILNLERKSREEIMAINGIGQLKAMQIEAVMEIVRRYCGEKVGKRPQLTGSKVIYDMMKTTIGNLPHEEMWAIFVNRSHHVIGKFRASMGGSVSTVFDIKKIIRQAILARAEGVVLCHNHPSGTLKTSAQDDAVTRRFKEACAAVDLRPLDHLIITTDGFYSYFDHGNIL